jgi:hypothetical protein
MPSRTTEATDGQMYVAVESGCAEIGGQTLPFVKNKTHVRSGHPLLSACPGYFVPTEERVDYEMRRQRRRLARSAAGNHDQEEYMLKRLRQLRDEIDMTLRISGRIPIPRNHSRARERQSFTSNGLEQARDNLTSMIDKLNDASTKRQDAYNEQMSTPEGRDEAVREANAEATKVDYGQGEEVAEKGSVTDPGGQSGVEAGKSGGGSGGKK